jgi:hypothetical protein
VVLFTGRYPRGQLLAKRQSLPAIRPWPVCGGFARVDDGDSDAPGASAVGRGVRGLRHVRGGPERTHHASALIHADWPRTH